MGFNNALFLRWWLVSLMLVFFAGESSAQDTLVTYESPYYRFEQIYPHAKYVLHFGEVTLQKQNGETEYFFPREHDSETNNPLKLAVEDYAAVSGSPDFQTEAGDTITYFWNDTFAAWTDTASGWYQIPDTLIYYIEFVNLDNGEVVTLDSNGTLPFNHFRDFRREAKIPPVPKHKLRYNDTAITKRHAVPLSKSDGIVNARLRIRPVFRGDPSRFNLERWDEWYETYDGSARSDEERAHSMQLATAQLHALDSLIENAANTPLASSILKTSVDGDIVKVMFQEVYDESVQLFAMDIDGRHMEELDVAPGVRVYELDTTEYPRGIYMVAIRAGARTIGMGRFELKEQ
ncbi:MAG: hypothetical protein CL946_08910 [Ectothiorhodospiraceae bacterium]|nr:hypothetical protein [Ectothiorhodospiraceae bacterium]